MPSDGRPPDAGPLVLGDDEVHLWLAEVTNDAPPVIERLSPAERARAARFHFEPDRRLYAAAHVFVRQILSRYAAVAPADWTFDTGPWGRPEIAPAQNPGRLRFNLSHSGTRIACVVARRHDVGVDVEPVRTARTSDALLARILGDDEQIAMGALDGAARERAFIERWTLKEAYVKATGRGLGVDVRGVQFDLPDAGAITVRLGSPAAAPDTAWTFWRRALPDDYVVSVAVKGNGRAVRLIEPVGVPSDGD